MSDSDIAFAHGLTAGQDEAISRCYSTLNRNGVTGRLRVGREGFNATLTGPYEGVRAFTRDLREFMPGTFGETDFKIVDNQPDNHALKGLKASVVSRGRQLREFMMAVLYPKWSMHRIHRSIYLF